MFRDLLGFVDMIKQPELRELLHLITTGAGVADRLKAAPAFPVSSLDPLCFLNLDVQAINPLTQPRKQRRLAICFRRLSWQVLRNL